MTRFRFRPLVALSALVMSTMLVAAACGSRTGLFVEISEDASHDVTVDVVPDRTLDAPHDAFDADADADVIIDALQDRDGDTGADVIVGCRPRSCAELGYQCGENGDGCGNVQNCGMCPAPQACAPPPDSPSATTPPRQPNTLPAPG